MAARPTDDELREMLRALPHPSPPAGFASGVMARVRAEERRRRRRPWLLAAAAVALAASALLLRSVGDGGASGSGAPVVVDAAPGPAVEVAGEAAGTAETAEPDRREFEAIVEEYRRLAEEIEAMRRLGGAPPYGPLIRVGGDEELDLFLDLESWLEHPERPKRPPGASLVVPAADRRPRR